MLSVYKQMGKWFSKGRDIIFKETFLGISFDPRLPPTKPIINAF